MVVSVMICADRPTEVRLGVFIMSVSYISEQTMVSLTSNCR